MIAWLIRTAIAGELLAAVAISAWLNGPAGWPAWAAIAVGLSVPALLHGWTIGLQSLAGAWQRRRSALRAADVARAGLSGAPAVRAWLGETLASLRSFWLLMAWRGAAPLPSGNDAARIPVVLVHGYFCNRAIWRPMARRLAARGHPVESPNLEPPLAAIDDYLPAVDAAVERLRARTGARRVALVGHSMGGLVIRAWLRRHGTDRAAAVVTLGSPHQGTWSARHALGRNVAQMRQDSPWLATLASSESAALRRLFTVVMSLHDNIVMPQTAQALEGADNRVVVGIGHVALARDRSVYGLVTEALDRAAAMRDDRTVEGTGGSAELRAATTPA